VSLEEFGIGVLCIAGVKRECRTVQSLIVTAQAAISKPCNVVFAFLSPVNQQMQGLKSMAMDQYSALAVGSRVAGRHQATRDGQSTASVLQAGLTIPLHRLGDQVALTNDGSCN
jgi:hypothetical protein